jgi:hypothetical protein
VVWRDAVPGKASTGDRAIIIGFAAVTIVGVSLADHRMLRVYDLRFAEATARRGFNSDQDTPQYAPKR